MNYKESLFFIGKCLTINHEEHNKILVEEQLKSKLVDWDNIVRVSTAHYVFPALYCNLKRAGFLEHVPTDLVEYMQHITDLNRERNQQIIEQAKEINELLLAYNITPIFLKGTAFLLQGLYEDIAERMVGDIDFLVKRNQTELAYNTLTQNNYTHVSDDEYFFPHHRHLPRLKKEERIAAVEIHSDMLKEKYIGEFNYETTIQNSFIKNNFNFLGHKEQLSLAIIANQINDNEQLKYKIALRNAYDVYLLSQKINSLKAVEQYKLLFNPLNNFLIITQFVFNSNSIFYKKTNSSEIYLSKFLSRISDQKKAQKFDKKINTELFFKERFKILGKLFYDKEMRSWLIKRVTDKNWLKAKYNQLLSKPSH